MSGSDLHVLMSGPDLPVLMPQYMLIRTEIDYRWHSKCFQNLANDNQCQECVLLSFLQVVPELGPPVIGSVGHLYWKIGPLVSEHLANLCSTTRNSKYVIHGLPSEAARTKIFSYFINK